MAQTSHGSSDYVSNMDDFTLSKAVREMGEDPVDRLAALQAFREWIDKQKAWLHTPTGAIFSHNLPIIINLNVCAVEELYDLNYSLFSESFNKMALTFQRD